MKARLKRGPAATPAPAAATNIIPEGETLVVNTGGHPEIMRPAAFSVQAGEFAEIDLGAPGIPEAPPAASRERYRPKAWGPIESLKDVVGERWYPGDVVQIEPDLEAVAGSLAIVLSIDRDGARCRGECGIEIRVSFLQAVRIGRAHWWPSGEWVDGEKTRPEPDVQGAPRSHG